MENAVQGGRQRSRNQSMDRGVVPRFEGCPAGPEILEPSLVGFTFPAPPPRPAMVIRNSGRMVIFIGYPRWRGNSRARETDRVQTFHAISSFRIKIRMIYCHER